MWEHEKIMYIDVTKSPMKWKIKMEVKFLQGWLLIA